MHEHTTGGGGGSLDGHANYGYSMCYHLHKCTVSCGTGLGGLELLFTMQLGSNLVVVVVVAATPAPPNKHIVYTEICIQ